MDQNTSTPNTQNNYWQYCPNRLPCGYCRLMSSICPLSGQTITINYATCCESKPSVNSQNVTLTEDEYHRSVAGLSDW